MYKKFLRFYKKEFIPITKYEERDRRKSLENMDNGKSLVFLMFFVLSYKLKTFRITSKKGKTDDSIISTFIGSTIIGFFSWVAMHCFCLKIMFEKNFYIRNRLIYEKSINYDRTKFNKVEIDDLLDEYPFAGNTNYLFSDFSIKNQLYFREEGSGNEEIDPNPKKKRLSRIFGSSKGQN